MGIGKGLLSSANTSATVEEFLENDGVVATLSISSPKEAKVGGRRNRTTDDLVWKTTPVLSHLGTPDNMRFGFFF